MYYENKNESRKYRFIMFVLMIVIISLLSILIIRLDDSTYDPIVRSEYKAEKLSTKSEESVDTLVSKNINDIVKCVVGISKLKQVDSTFFLNNNNEEKLGIGSGVIITDSGYILTNQHVAGNKYSNCFVTLEDGKTYTGTVVWEDSNIDLAIVKIKAMSLKYIEFGDSDNITLAQEVYAIGNPIGFEFQRTITKGIISGINRTVKVDEQNYMEDLIQTDATINEGNSGGALINQNGELIGINTVKINDADGIGFAVPINIVKPILKKLLESGSFEEAYLGLYGYDKEVIPYLDSKLIIKSGVYIASIPADGPLFYKDVKVGDVILEIDNIKIDKMNDLKKYIYSKKPKDKVLLKIRRDNNDFEIEVELSYKQ